MSMGRRVAAVGWLAGSLAVAAPAAGQGPETAGVVAVRAGGDAETDGRLPAPAGHGFVVGDGRVIASVAGDVIDFVVAAAGGEEHAARRLAYDGASGLGLLAVPALTAPPYPFARDPAAAGHAVHGATRDGDTGVVEFLSGSVLEVLGGTATDGPDVIRHDAYAAGRRNAGAPLLNGCGQIVGVVVRAPAAVSAGSERAVPGAWLRTRFGDEMNAATVETPCPPVPDPSPAVPPDAAVPAPDPAPRPGQTPSSPAESTPVPDPEAPAPDPETPAPDSETPAPDPETPVPDPETPVPEPETPTPEPEVTPDPLELSREDRRLIELGLTVAVAGFGPGEVDGRFDDATRDALSQWQAAAGEEPTGILDRPTSRALLLLGRQQEVLAVAERQGRYARWTAAAALGATVVALLLWFVDRRSLAKSRLAPAGAGTPAQAAQPDVAGGSGRDRLASVVPAVLLDGAASQDEPLTLRIPGSAIGGADGAVVGRSPFDSTVVLDHVEVSRRHFRLLAHGASVLIEDLNSTNGTKLNDTPLAPGDRAPLPSGAVLHVGSLEFTVTLQT